MSWLWYGVDTDNSLVAVEDVPSGKTHLKCPYCRGALTAKKGRIKEHHFAHFSETCREVALRNDWDIPRLPLYDNFNLQLSGKELELLKQLWNGKSASILELKRLEKRGLVQWNPYASRHGKYEFTKLGKIPVGALSLMLFNQVQEPLLLEKLEDLETATVDALGIAGPEADLPERLTDLRIYRAQMRKILRGSLYYLEIQANGQTLYKIGVTQRPITERASEVERDLLKHFQSVSIKVLGTWAHRGNVEKYFKYRYRGFNYPIDSFTEYYKFDDPNEAKAALRDLRRMKPKVLSEVEQDILEGKPSVVEQIIQTEQKAEKRSLAIKQGMHRAQAWGVHVGRPAGAESEEAFLAKPSSQRALAALNQGLSLRQAANIARVAVNTVRKVRLLMQQGEH